MDTRVLTESDVHWIVRIFLEDGELVLNWERLCSALGLTLSQLEDIKFTVAVDRSQTHGFLALALTKWININRTSATVEKLNDVLRNERFMFVADKILAELPRLEGTTSNKLARTIDPSSIWFKVPDKVIKFTGRLDEMERLHKSIMGQNIEKNGHNEVTVITTLSGLGGIGKTTLAIHYAWEYFSNNFYFNVIWINAETTCTIEKYFRGLAGKVELNARVSFTLIELVSRIYEHFEQTSTLFVFDNVEQHEHVKDFLPNVEQHEHVKDYLQIKSPKSTRQYVLITSRNREWNRKTDLIVLNVFPEKDSVEFLKSYLKLGTDEEIELALEIARGLQNLPLAIRQASAYIERVCSDDFLGTAQVMRHYLELLETNSKRVLNFECDSYERTISSTWKITLNKIKRQNYLAVRIMQIISYYGSDNIPIQLFRNIPKKRFFERIRDSMIYKNSSINESTVSEAVKLLSQFSMVTRDSQSDVSVHRLVQKVIRDEAELTFKSAIEDEARLTAKISLKASCDYQRNCLLHATSVGVHIRSTRLRYY